MNAFIIIAILVVGGVASYIWWDSKKNKKKLEEIIVCYSEKVGESIVEKDVQLKGFCDYKEDIFKIPGLQKILPIPPARTFIPTRSGKKKVYLIKIDSNRFAYRIPSVDNSVFIQVRDNNGNPVKKNGKPLLKKLKWQFCDDVVEPDVKHWEENIIEKMTQKHKLKGDMLAKWLGAIIVGTILIAGIVTIHMTTKFVSEQLKEQRTLSTETAEKVEESAGMIGNLIKKFDDKSGK